MNPRDGNRAGSVSGRGQPSRGPPGALAAPFPWGSGLRALLLARPAGPAPGHARRSPDQDLLPEAHALRHVRELGPRRLVRPRDALVAHAVEHDVVEAHAVWAGAV